MRRLDPTYLCVLIAIMLLSSVGCARPAAWTDRAAHKSAFVTVNGIRLNYLDWGGAGPVLIFIHGSAGSPHGFDDLAPAFTDHFRVVAYARRGAGRSDAKGPYDVATLTEDLRTLMDSLGIATATLVGHSMGGDELTFMAGAHPDRVDRLVYLEGGYDWADSGPMFAGFPSGMDPTASAMRSIDAWRGYIRTVWMPAVLDSSRFEAMIRDVVVVQSDGTVRPAISDSVARALDAAQAATHRDYTKVRSPALALYAASFLDAHAGDAARRARVAAWERDFVVPFRQASINRITSELRGIEILKVPGTHNDFLFTSRDQVVAAMRKFLEGS